METLPSVIVVVGPTSSGKSDFAVELAHKNNGEIISADSRQIYQGLDIGTGKITEREMKGIPHHMLDIIPIEKSFSVAEYISQALPIIDDIIMRGKTPIICGGTGQYVDALIYTNTLPEVPPNQNLRNNLEQYTTDELYEKLLQKDPNRANHIDRHNRVRLIRALEIVETIGKVPRLSSLTPRFSVTLYLLNPSKEVLQKRVHTRLMRRLEQGMIEEVENLIKQGFDPATIEKRGIEYKYIVKYLHKDIDKDELIRRLTIATWQYAKRQRTWNKKYESIAILVNPN